MAHREATPPPLSNLGRNRQGPDRVVGRHWQRAINRRRDRSGEWGAVCGVCGEGADETHCNECKLNS